MSEFPWGSHVRPKLLLSKLVLHKGMGGPKLISQPNQVELVWRKVDRVIPSRLVMRASGRNKLPDFQLNIVRGSDDPRSDGRTHARCHKRMPQKIRRGWTQFWSSAHALLDEIARKTREFLTRELWRWPLSERLE